MNAEKLTDWMQTLTDSNEMSAGVLIISKNGQRVYKNKCGFLDKAREIPVQYNTLFRAMSMTKVLTAAAVMKLYEEGKIGLDDNISDYIPEYREIPVRNGIGGMKKAKREVTIRDLLTHSSGIGMSPISGTKMTRLSFFEDTLEQRVKRWSAVPLDFQPGTRTGYSQAAGFDLLGYIIEIISGKRLDRYLNDILLNPLKMADTGFHLNTEQKKRLIPLYRTKNGKLIDMTDTASDINGFAVIGENYFAGSCGIYTTAEDYHRFTEMLCNEGSYTFLNGSEPENIRILKPETVWKMHTEMAYEHPVEIPGLEWGLGVRVRVNPAVCGSRAYPGTYGWSGAFGTHMFVSPKEKLAVTFMMNRENIGGADSYIIQELEGLICTEQ